MVQRRQTPLSSRFVIGLVIAAIGFILLAGNLGWLDARHLFRSVWPLALVAVGVAMVRDPTQRKGQPWGWVLITIGIWIFADNIGWIMFDIWDLIVPGILLFIGGTLVWRTMHEQQPRAKKDAAPNEPSAEQQASSEQNPHTEYVRLPHADQSPEFVRSFAFMSYCELHPVMHPLRGGDLNAVMGGIKLDLRDTGMEGDQAILDVFAFWGGIEIFVPPDWIVSSKVTTIIGGFVDSRRPTKVIPTKTLIIRGFNLMSGIEVKN
jgi:predicted membrane protein